MKKIISFLLLISIFLTSCSKQEETAKIEIPTKYVEIETVKEKTFSEDLKVSGKVYSSKETSISPQISGIVKTINYKVGDKVKAGDIIAKIDTQTNLANITLNNANNSYSNTLSIYNLTKESIKKDIDTAKLQYENAITSRDNIYKTTQKQLQLAQAQLESVSKQEKNTISTANSSIDLSKKSLENARLNLENFDKNYQETLKSLEVKRKSILDKKEGLYDTLKSTIDTALSTFDSGLSTVDNILGVTDLNKYANDSFESYLSVKDTSLKSSAENIFRESKANYDKIKSNYDNSNPKGEDVVKYYSQILSLSEQMVKLYDKMTQVLDNSITSSSFSDTSLTSLKTTNKTSQSYILTLKQNLVSLNNTLTDLNNSIVDIENTISSTKTQLDTQRLTIEQGVKISQASYDNALSSTNLNIDSVSSAKNTTQIQLENTIESINSNRELADNSVKIAENQYKSAKAKYDTQLASTKIQLDSIDGQKDSATQQIENSQIKAPFDGVITAKNVEIGALVSPGVQMFSISSKSGKIIKVDINSENIKFISKEKEVKIEKDGKMYDGIVSLVPASPDTNSKMFKVEISLVSQDFYKEANLGDYVDIFIKKENNSEKSIIVPFSALISGSNSTYSVFLVGSGSIVSQKEVKIGASNSSEVVITKGLKTGDKIVVSGALELQSGDKVENR